MSSGEDALDAADDELSVDGGDSGGVTESWVLAIVVGALFGLWEAVLGQFISAGDAVETALEEAGGAFTFAGGKVGDVVLGILSLPFDVAADVAGSLGPLAPVAIGIAWALAAAATGLIVYVLWRLFTWI